MRKLYTVEYSKKQRCFHQDELNRVLELNYEKFVKGIESDWQIIGIFETMKEADIFSEIYCKPVLKKLY